MISELRNLPAPAKLNLFLHVTGRREDGYHTIETVFELIDLCDRIDLLKRNDGQIELLSPPAEDSVITPDPETNLVVRAARALATSAGTVPGVSISLRKVIPIGGGLGGGSSDAATVLIGLNRLWGLGMTNDRLAQIGLSLGADVPIFILGRTAFGGGIGERLHPISLPIRQYLVIQPPVSVPTAQIFQSPELTRNSKPLKIDGFSPSSFGSRAKDHGLGRKQGQDQDQRQDHKQEQRQDQQQERGERPGREIGLAILGGRNDLQPVAEQLYPAVRVAIEDLKWAASACGIDPSQVRMSGSGACIFVPLENQQAGLRVIEQLQRKTGATRSLRKSVSQEERRDERIDKGRDKRQGESQGGRRELDREEDREESHAQNVGQTGAGFRAWVVNSLPRHYLNGIS